MESMNLDPCVAVDEFHDSDLPFMGDSVAYLELLMADECWRRSPAVRYVNGDGFEKLDDELLTSIFSEVTVKQPQSCSNHPSLCEIHLPKSEPEEELSAEGLSCSPCLIRILANRQSAQRSRVRKLQYITELERRVSLLQAEVSVLSPRVVYMEHQRLLLSAENSVMKQRLAALAHDRIFKDANQEAMKNEIERLRQVYYQKNLEMTPEIATALPLESSPRALEDGGCSGTEEQL